MKRRILSLALALTFVLTAFSAVNVSAEDVFYAGPRDFALTEENLVSAEKASMAGNLLSLQAGGSATFGFYLPFNATSVTLAFEEDAVPITVASGEGSFVIDPKESSPCLYNLETVDRIGEKLYTFSAERKTAFSITYTVSMEAANWYYTDKDIDLTDEEFMTLNTVVIKINSPMMLVNGARRYIDNYDITSKPIYVDGSIYMPVHALARTLNLYYEDLQDKKYVLLRYQDKELVFTEEFSYSNNMYGEKNPIDNLVHYQDGTTYLPLRYVAEYYGRCVGYYNGTVVMDDNKYYVEEMIDETTAVNRFIESEFEDMIPTGTVGTTYYVAQSENASDDNDGSYDAPFLTISKAGEVAKAGDTVIVREGVYRETVTVKNNGTPTAPVVFKAAEGERVVISALEEVSEFAPYGDANMITAKVNYDMGYGRNQVFYGDKSIPEARYPNEPLLSLGGDNEPLSDNWPVTAPLDDYDETGLTLINDRYLDQPEGYWDGATFACMRGAAYYISYARVEHSEPGYLHFDKNSLGDWSGGGNAVNKGKWWGMIVGHRNAIDAPGEWVIENGTLYMIAPEGVAMEDLTVEVKARQLVVDAPDNKCIQFEGFETIGGSMRFNNAELCMIKDCNIRYNNHWTYSRDQRNGWIDDKNKEDKNGAPLRGEVGIFDGGENNIFVGNIFDEAAGAAIYGTGVYMYIENNLIKNCGYGGSYVAGINYNDEVWQGAASKRGGMVIVGNTAYNAGRSPIQITTPTGAKTWKFLPCTIAYNDFHNGTLTSLDTGITYTYFCDYGTARLKTQFNNNIVYATYTENNPYSLGLYQDGGTTNIDTYNNLVFATEPGVGFTHGYLHVYTGAAHRGQSAVWDNKIIKDPISEGRDGLEPEHYPYGMMFDAGSTIGREPYTKNYDLIMSGSEEIGIEKGLYFSENAEAGPGAEKVGRDVRLDKKGEWVKFADVDFGDGCNRFTLHYKGDRYEIEPIVTMVLDDIEKGREYKIDNTWLHGRTTEDRVNREKQLPTITGKRDVYIKMYNPTSYLDITGIQVWNQDEDKSTTLEEKGVIYGGYYDEWIKTGDGYLEGEPQVKESQTANNGFPVAIGTWTGVTLEYRDITIESLSDIMFIKYATGEGYGGQKVEVRIDSMDTEPVAVFTSEANGWGNYTESEVEMITPLEPDDYDIFVTFTDEDPTAKSKTMDFAQIRFANKEYEAEKVNTIIAAEFTETIESLDGEFAPEIFYTKRNGISRAVVRNTWPGTVFIYKDFELTSDVSRANVQLGSAGIYAGQSAQIRIGSETAEPIAELVVHDTGAFSNWDGIDVDLKHTLKAGKYDIYVTFIEPDGKYVAKSCNFIGIRFRE